MKIQCICTVPEEYILKKCVLFYAINTSLENYVVSQNVCGSLLTPVPGSLVNVRTAILFSSSES